MRRLAIAAIFALFPIGLLAGPQTLTLKDGRSFSGTFVSGTASSILFRDDSGVRRRFSLNEIRSIDFSNQRTYSGANTVNSSGNSRYRANRVDRSRTVAEARTVPAGAEIVVRTNETINSETATPGETFSAVIDRDLMDNTGAVVAPRGSEAQLVIRDVRGGGATGSPNLVLDLQSVTANGWRYLVSTGDVERSSNSGIGRNKRTAEMMGGGTALGTLLGAIAGGGKGAVIGAIAGAAAGGTAQVLTRGKQVSVPAETQLTFRLDQPLRLEAYR